jgi:hypothetical protein
MCHVKYTKLSSAILNLNPNNASGGGAQRTPEAFMGFPAEQTSE